MSSERKGLTWDEVVGTALGLGYVPRAPGTAGSAGAAAVYWILGGPWFWWLAAIVGATLLGGVAGTRMERRLGREDPQIFVLDEVAGTWLTLLWAPRVWWVVLLGFGLFRLFDIAKPFPVRRAERLPGGWGIMADDLVAGLMGLAVLQAVLFGVAHLTGSVVS